MLRLWQVKDRCSVHQSSSLVSRGRVHLQRSASAASNPSILSPEAPHCLYGPSYHTNSDDQCSRFVYATFFQPNIKYGRLAKLASQQTTIYEHSMLCTSEGCGFEPRAGHTFCLLWHFCSLFAPLLFALLRQPGRPQGLLQALMHCF